MLNWQMTGSLLLVMACAIVLQVSRPQKAYCRTSTGKSGSQTIPESLKEKGYYVEEIQYGLYWVTDGAYNTMFLVYSNGVVAVDPLPTLGQKYLQAIAGVTDKPVTHVIYSHEHTDHIGAAYLFLKNAIYIAQKETADLLARRHDPRRPVPTVTFRDTYTLTVGDQTLKLYYKDANHESGNIFIYAPRQKVLMLVDVIYPGFMPYKNLGIAQDIQGYEQAHYEALSFDFTTFVGGHVNRLGNRHDVETSLEFVKDLRKTSAIILEKNSFFSYIKLHPKADKWDLHNEYEKDLVDKCYAQLFPRWNPRLQDTATYLKDNCWAMIEAHVVELPPEKQQEGK